MSTPARDLTDRLQQLLTAAMRARDREQVGVLRAVLGSIQNAQAVPADDADPAVLTSPIAGAVDGLGAGDVPRRDLNVDDLTAVLSNELAERVTAAEQYRTLGRVEAAERMDREAAVIAALLSDGVQPT